MKKTSFLFLCIALISRLGAADPAAPQAPVAPAQLELARQVIKATQFDRMFDQMGAQMQQMAAQSLNLSPTQTPAQKDAAMKTLGELTQLSMDAVKGMIEKVDVIYAEVYSEAELKAMLAFFQSSEGKSMLQKQPVVAQHLKPLIQAMQMELMPKIQQIVEKAKAEAAATPAQATPAPVAPAAPTAAKVTPQ